MKNTPLTLGILLIIVAVIGIYFANRNIDQTTTTDTGVPTTDSSTSPTSTSPNTIPTSPTIVDINVDIRSFAYSPATLTIKKGTKVTWTNYDTAPHTVTSVSGGVLNSPRLTTGQSFSYTFANTGTVNYYCTIHPNMKAAVIVTE